MTALWLAAPAISLLLLGAHFLREGSWVLVAACVALRTLASAVAMQRVRVPKRDL